MAARRGGEGKAGSCLMDGEFEFLKMDGFWRWGGQNECPEGHQTARLEVAERDFISAVLLNHNIIFFFFKEG